MRGIGIVVNEVAFLDHVVPLLQILGFPLLVCDPYLKELVEIYYPPMEVLVAEEYCLDSLLAPYDTYLYTEHYRRATGFFQFGEFYASKPARSLFLFHGNSDKYRALHWIEQLCGEDRVLVYGRQIYDWMREKGVVERVGKVLFCGNYRRAYFEKHRSFFSLSLPGERRLLYAPTWTSPVLTSARRATYSNVLDVYERIVEEFADYTLYIKLHPYFEQLMPKEAERMERCDFGPPIYPLLDQVDLFLGDYSSINYDFLSFNRPLYLFGEEQPWAVPVTVETMREKIERREKREGGEAYRYAFGEAKPLEQLKEEIFDAY